MLPFKKTTLLFVLTVFIPVALSAQQPSQSFTLDAALDYALKNNLNLQNAKLDLEAARYKVKEVAASGLPQINGTLAYNNYIQIPTQIVRFSDTTPYMPFKFGIPHTVNASVTASQLLFDGTFFLGLKASKEFVTLAEQVHHSSEIDLRIGVTKAYYLVLLLAESKKLIENNIVSLEKTTGDTRKLYESGFVEKMDVSRLELALSNLNIQRTNLDNQYQYAMKVLKLQMGMDLTTEITLADDLRTLNEKEQPVLADADTKDFSSRPEYQILNQQMRLNILDMKRYKVGYLPTLSAFITHQQNSFRQSFNYFSGVSNPSEQWFPGTLWGVQLSVPIFDGGRKYHQLQQARIGYYKTSNSMKNFQLAASLEAYNAKIKLTTAMEQVVQQEKNMELAQEINKISKAKYLEGVGSSLDVTQSETDLKNSQANYLMAVYDLLSAKIELKKAVGKF